MTRPASSSVASRLARAAAKRGSSFTRRGPIFHEHWRVEFRQHYFRSARALQWSLDRFLDFYNTQRPHRGYRPPPPPCGGGLNKHAGLTRWGPVRSVNA